ncbi:MAG: hypothetical protein C4516_01675 [Oxalobacter sp.]|nr:MAG: hypothetical protein C4516_01675 [Oxalobacter sp.]
MNTLTARHGWNWIKQGFAIFRMHPGQFSLLFSTYLVILIALAFIPFLGSFLQAFFAPIFSMIFMIACAQIERKGELNPLQLRASFDPPVGKRIFTLGAIYVAIGLFLSLAVMFVFSSLGNVLMGELLKGGPAVKTTAQQDIGVLITMLTFFLIFMPPLWYAAPLIVWQKMPVFQAMFYSFFAVFRAIRAFIVYFLGWMLVGVLCPVFISGLLATVVGKSFAMVLLFLMTIFMSILLYCSFYPTYIDVFGKPDLPHTPHTPFG